MRPAQSFTPPSRDVYARIRKAVPLARVVIAERGIDPAASVEIAEEFDRASANNGFAVTSGKAWEYIYGVFELGMAVGLLLDRSALNPPARPTRPRSNKRRRATRPASSRRVAGAKKGGA